MLKTDLLADAQSTLHTLIGSASEVDAAVTELMCRYPPEGYSTFLKKQTTLPDGQTKAEIFRFNSCD
jgi:hypothetical protein